MIKVDQSFNQKKLAYYCECFSNLKVYKTQKKGDALNKPILLLSVIDLITQNVITDKNIYISDDLIETFKKYWQVIASSPFKGSDFALPFFHLKNDKCKFWHLKYSSEYEGGRPQSIPKIRDDVSYAFLDDELFSLIQNEITRKELIDALVSSWLSSDENEIGDILKINENFQNESLEQEIITESTETLKNNPKWSLKKTLIRNAFFRKAVVSVYDCQCAFCGLKVTKTGTQNIVDGAHIKPFSAFYDSRIHNGIALCKNHHWAFDRGWFAVDDKYKIIVSKELEEVSPHARTITEFHGEILILPKVEKYFPDIEALQWHRHHIFQP
ncbi:HNH endonuclease [Trichormus variabilis]|uniref:Endonuclease n=1 Tax=Trichormus variabilis SAG 1403-4b TaxID=447716 RepID=A0A433UWG7_ANAVA|nr:HNH endonuclease [Trichormus variabilis]MBD2626190.1 HNH endonuclease [Trichormus variabilis FACHB-164]RUS98191.1 endonuclease [Trichormus variabilis SAG 1403-4b]